VRCSKNAVATHNTVTYIPLHTGATDREMIARPARAGHKQHKFTVQAICDHRLPTVERTTQMTDTPAKEKAAPKTAAKKAASAMPSFDMANLEMPAAFREMAEKGVIQAKEAYDSYKSMAEDATDAIEDTFATINKGTTDLQSKALGAAKTQFNANFDFVEKMLGVKTLAEAMEIQSEFARKQFDTLSEQAKEFQDLASKVQAETAKPFQDGLNKAMTQWKTAV